MSNYYCIINSLVYGEIVSCIVLMLFIIRFTFCSYFHFIFIRGLLSEFNYHNIFQQHDIFIQFLNTYFVSRVSLSINLFNTICVGLLEANTIQIVCACFFVYHFSQPNSLCNEISCYLFSLCVCVRIMHTMEKLIITRYQKMEHQYFWKFNEAGRERGTNNIIYAYETVTAAFIRTINQVWLDN